MVRILVWDDEGTANDTILHWCREIDLEPEPEIFNDWTRAAAAIVNSYAEPWHIIVTDMYDSSLHAQEYQKEWQKYSGMTQLREVLDSATASRYPLVNGQWQKWNMWGTGLVLLGRAFGAKELLLASNYLNTHQTGGQQSEAEKIVVAFADCGIPITGLLDKNINHQRSKARFLECVARYLPGATTSVPELYRVIMVKNGLDEQEPFIDIHVYEKRQRGGDAPFTIKGEHAFIFYELAHSNRNWINKEQIRLKLNQRRRRLGKDEIDRTDSVKLMINRMRERYLSPEVSRLPDIASHLDFDAMYKKKPYRNGLVCSGTGPGKGHTLAAVCEGFEEDLVY